MGEGVGESEGTHRTSPRMNGAFLERTQSPIHRSPQGTSLNKYGQRFSPIWKPSLPISQRKQASQRRIEVSPPRRGALSEARAVKCRCGSKTPPPISFSNSWKDGKRGVPELQVSDIPDVHADCVFPRVKQLGPPADHRGWGDGAGILRGAKSATGMHSPCGGRSSDWKSWAQETVEFTPSGGSGGGESSAI